MRKKTMREKGMIRKAAKFFLLMLALAGCGSQTEGNLSADNGNIESEIVPEDAQTRIQEMMNRNSRIAL